MNDLKAFMKLAIWKVVNVYYENSFTHIKMVFSRMQI